MKVSLVLLLLLLCEICLVKTQYEVPDATVEVFTPRGLRVSIPGKYVPTYSL